MIDRTFLFQVGIAFVVLGGLLAVVLFNYATEEVLVAAMVGATMSVLNAVAGTLAGGLAMGKSATGFLKIVLGGMAVRMMVLLGLLFVFIKVAGLHVLALTATLFGFYLVFLVLEIFSIQRLAERRTG